MFDGSKIIKYETNIINNEKPQLMALETYVSSLFCLVCRLSLKFRQFYFYTCS